MDGFEERRDGGVKSGKCGNVDNYENDDETMSQSEEREVQINHKRSS